MIASCWAGTANAQSWGVATHAQTTPLCCAELPGVVDTTQAYLPIARSTSRVTYKSKGFGIPNDPTGSAFASAALARGTLAASAASSDYVESTGGAALLDRLQFKIEAAPETSTTVRMQFFYHGVFGPLTQSGSLQSYFNVNIFQATNGPFGTTYHGSAGLGITRSHDNSFPDWSTHGESGWKSISIERSGNTFFIDAMYDLVGPSPYVDMGVSLTALTRHESSADFSNTASIRLFLPQGVSFTSASGAFLAASAVPEPAIWALMIGGFGAIGLAARRRRVLAAA